MRGGFTDARPLTIRPGPGWFDMAKALAPGPYMLTALRRQTGRTTAMPHNRAVVEEFADAPAPLRKD
jgi:hypothetical protein